MPFVVRLSKQFFKKNYVVTDEMAAADSRDSFGTVDYTHEDTAGAFADLETAKFTQPLALNGTEDDAEGMEVHTSAKMAIEPTPGTANARQKSRSPPRHEEEWEPFGLTSVHLSQLPRCDALVLDMWRGGRQAAGALRD